MKIKGNEVLDNVQGEPLGDPFKGVNLTDDFTDPNSRTRIENKTDIIKGRPV